MKPDSGIEAHSQVAVVTGGAKNIGLAISLKLAEIGFGLIINTKSDETAGMAAVAKARKSGNRAYLVVSDVSTEKGALLLINSAIEKFGRIDLLVNNAGPFLLKEIPDMSLEEWRFVFDGNLTSAFLCSRFAIPHLRRAGNGHIIFLGAPKAGMPLGTGAYGIAKTGVVLLARYIAEKEGNNGIRANVVNPGFIRTSNYTEEMAEKMKDAPALGRLGTPKDIANAVAFLAGPNAGYISGAVLDVGGGLWV